MARNKTQPKIESFLKELSKISEAYGMIIDVNGGGKASLEISDSRYLEGAPLVLYAKSGENNYRKVGYVYYSFLGNSEAVVYNFEPAKGMPYTPVVLTEDDIGVVEEPSEPAPANIAEAINKAKNWSNTIEKP